MGISGHDGRFFDFAPFRQGLHEGFQTVVQPGQLLLHVHPHIEGDLLVPAPASVELLAQLAHFFDKPCSTCMWISSSSSRKGRLPLDLDRRIRIRPRRWRSSAGSGCRSCQASRHRRCCLRYRNGRGANRPAIEELNRSIRASVDPLNLPSHGFIRVLQSLGFSTPSMSKARGSSPLSASHALAFSTPSAGKAGRASPLSASHSLAFSTPAPARAGRTGLRVVPAHLASLASCPFSEYRRTYPDHRRSFLDCGPSKSEDMPIESSAKTCAELPVHVLGAARKGAGNRDGLSSGSELKRGHRRSGRRA